MNVFGPLLLSFSLSLLVVPQANGQGNKDSTFDPETAWDQTFLKQSINQYRTASGHPGPQLWQNRVQYNIDATLDTAKQRIHGSVELEYTNHSPSPLHSIWLHVSLPDTSSRDAQTTGLRFEINQVTATSTEQATTPTTRRTGTRLQIQFDEPIPKNGGSTTLRVKYVLPISGPGLPARTSTRMARFTKSRAGSPAWPCTTIGVDGNMLPASLQMTFTQGTGRSTIPSRFPPQ